MTTNIIFFSPKCDNAISETPNPLWKGNVKLSIFIDCKNHLLITFHIFSIGSSYNGFHKDYPFGDNFMLSPQAIDNLEYHLVKPNSASSNPMCSSSSAMGGIRRKTLSSDDDTDDHEYYNDYDKLQRELQPLNHRAETTV